MKKIIAFIFCIAVISSCGVMKPVTGGSIELSGTIDKRGMTTYQYGSHLLKSEDKTYALKSSTINLDTYLNKQVTVKGTKITGYPIEGGPDFIEVTEIKVR